MQAKHIACIALPTPEVLAHIDPAVAAEIHQVMAWAYAQEAQLLGVKHFAPLQETVQDIAQRKEWLLGLRLANLLAGVVSVGPDDEPQQLRIGSLVVRPQMQRRGIARLLMQTVLARGTGMVFSVSTAELNLPALALYESLGFVAYKRGTVGPEDLALVKLRRLPR
jgi:ribosomal protein S18 acetylase RimI-like enzyme